MHNWKTDSQTGLQWLEPDWPGPARVRAVSTSRHGGLSEGFYASLNLALHVGDEPALVGRNRALLRDVLELPDEPFWLNQVHGCEVTTQSSAPTGCDAVAPGVLPTATLVHPCTADAAWTDRAGQVCAVMTADCLPLLLCDVAGNEVAAVHAGWRGLCDGVIEAAVARFHASPEALLAWLGPAIGPLAFEVGSEVRDAFIAQDTRAIEAFTEGAEDKWLADIFRLARQRLGRAGVDRVFGGGICTHGDSERFFSYRRDGVTGRMATLIWLEVE